MRTTFRAIETAGGTDPIKGFSSLETTSALRASVA